MPSFYVLSHVCKIFSLHLIIFACLNLQKFIKQTIRKFAVEMSAQKKSSYTNYRAQLRSNGEPALKSGLKDEMSTNTSLIHLHVTFFGMYGGVVIKVEKTKGCAVW